MPKIAPDSVNFRRRCAAAVALLLGLTLLPASSIAAQQPQAAQELPPAAEPPQPQPEVKLAPPTPIAVKKVELGEDDPWNPAWDIMIEKALPRSLVSRRRAAAVRPLCPRYRTMSRANRRAFWAYFFQALAGAEAGLKPTADVRHTDPEVAVIDRVTHRTVRQEGLLQLTYMDSLRYGCHFDWQRDKSLPVHDPEKTILQPRNNLLCGIRIVENQLIKQHKPLLAESSYWVTLRPAHPSFQVFLRQMANVPAACGSPLRHSAEHPRAPAADEARRATRPPVQPAPEPASDPPGAAGANDQVRPRPATSSPPP